LEQEEQCKETLFVFCCNAGSRNGGEQRLTYTEQAGWALVNSNTIPATESKTMIGSGHDEKSTNAPQLASNIEGFDNALRLLIAVAARAAANSQLPQDASLPKADLVSITEDLAAFSIEGDAHTESAGKSKQDTPVSPTIAGSADTVGEIDEKEVQESAKAIAAATAAETPKLSPEELRKEREKLKASIEKVEAANAQAAATRKKQARDWADEVARHCKFGESDER
jgi:hypothetical protein